MPHARYSSEEIGRRGREWYAQSVRAQVETPENIGKIVSIDIETGDYEIDEENLKAAQRLLARSPDAAIYGIRIGYNAVYALGGMLTREDGFHLDVDFEEDGPVRLYSLTDPDDKTS